VWGFRTGDAPAGAVTPAPRSELGRASALVLGAALPGVELDMTLPELARRHPRLVRYAPADREGLRAYQEELGPDRRALYFFATGAPARIARVQVAGKLEGDQAVPGHVLDRQARLGPPSGVWDCPASAGQVPTRRYQFRSGRAAALDVIALLGTYVSVTFYVASAEQIRRSLVDADCQPTPPERAARFPALPSPH
jgi:hypothetical protein